MIGGKTVAFLMFELDWLGGVRDMTVIDAGRILVVGGSIPWNPQKGTNPVVNSFGFLFRKRRL